MCKRKFGFTTVIFILELNTPWVHELVALCQIGPWTWKPDIQPLAKLLTPGPTRFCMVVLNGHCSVADVNWNWLRFKTWMHVKLGFYQPTPRQFLGQHHRKGRDRSIQRCTCAKVYVIRSSWRFGRWHTTCRSPRIELMQPTISVLHRFFIPRMVAWDDNTVRLVGIKP
jgi:hypothetical protein